MRKRTAGRVQALLFLGMVAAVWGEDWPQWRGPDLSGISQEKGWLVEWPKDGPKQVWIAEVGIGFSSFAVADGKVFTMGNAEDTDTVFCFDASTGTLVWKRSYPSKLGDKYYEGGPSATPTVDGKLVYTLGKWGDLFCLAVDSGSVVWSKNVAKELELEDPSWGFAGSPVVSENRLLLNAGSRGVALDKTNGKVLWSSGKEKAGYSSLVPFTMGNEQCAALFTAKTVAGVNIKDGRKVWEHPWKTSYDVNAAEPIVAGDKVFVSSGYNTGCAVIQFAQGKATVVWQNKEIRNQFNSSVLLDSHVYGIDGDSDERKATLKCLDFNTGAVRWAEPIQGTGAMMAADGKLIVLSGKGELMVVQANPAAAKVLSRAQVLGGRCWSAPVLANGRIYCRNGAGRVVCVDVQETRTAAK